SAEGVPAFHVQLVRLDLNRTCRRALRGLAVVERELELRRNGARDLVLHGEHVHELAIVALGPEVIAVAPRDELCRDAKATAGFSHTPLEHGGDVQLLADDTQVFALALERE